MVLSRHTRDAQLSALGSGTPSNAQFIDCALILTLVDKNDPEFNDERAAGKANSANSGWNKAMQKNLDVQRAWCFEDDVFRNDG